MEDILTLDKIFSLPNTILHNSELLNEYTKMLDEDYYNKFNIVEIKLDLDQFFKKFNNLKYTYRYNISTGNKIISNYDFGSVINSYIKSDKTAVLACNIIDSTALLNEISNAMINLSNKLTIEEAVYFVNEFFGNLSETKIADNLRICRNTLQKIKKSCLVKTWFELKPYLDELEKLNE